MPIILEDIIDMDKLHKENAEALKGMEDMIKQMAEE